MGKDRKEIKNPEKTHKTHKKQGVNPKVSDDKYWSDWFSSEEYRKWSSKCNENYWHATHVPLHLS